MESSSTSSGSGFKSTSSHLLSSEGSTYSPSHSSSSRKNRDKVINLILRMSFYQMTPKTSRTLDNFLDRIKEQ